MTLSAKSFQLISESKKQVPDLAYVYQNSLYLNITAKCPTACEFCIKFSWNYQYRSHNLLLTREPLVEEILKAVSDPKKYTEIVFCGYGESTYRLAEMKVIAESLRKQGAKRIRLNTIGMGNLIHGRNIAPELAEILDSVSVSLNTIDPEKWVKVHRPLPEFKNTGFNGVVQFVRDCSQTSLETWVTAVDLEETRHPQFAQFVRKLGAKVRLRPYLDDYESR